MDRVFAGTVEKPFCHRALVPALLQGLTPALPESWCSQIAPFLTPAGLPARHAGTYVALAIILVSSLLGYAFINGVIYRDYFSNSPYAGWLGSLSALAFMALFVTRKLGHIYDFTVLMLTAAMILTLVKGWLRSYLVLFAISCVNKETTILMTFAYVACLYDRIPRRRFVAYLLLQTFVFLVICLGVRYFFRNNNGMDTEIWLYHIPAMVDTWVGNLGLVAILGMVVAYRWREKPLVMRRAMVMVVPNLALYVFVVYPGEIRALYESLPLVSLFSMRTIELFTSSWASSCQTELTLTEELATDERERKSGADF